MLSIKTLYDNNEDFKKYVNKYCTTYKVSVEEALTHSVVREVGLHYIKNMIDN